MKTRRRMNIGVAYVALLVAVTGCSLDANGAAQDTQKIPRCPVFSVSGPTVIAFFDYEGEKDPNAGDALDDFQFSWQGVRSLVDPAAIRLHECYQRSFDVEVRGGRRRRVDATGVGYYLIAPGKDPRIERGVATDGDLIGVMKDYFGHQVVEKALAKPR